MDFTPMEMPQGTGFKDAVLSAAEARKVQIISQAQRQSAQQLDAAQQQCEAADYTAIMARYDRDLQRRQSAEMQAARKALLARRAQLVEELFARVARQLAAFTKTKDYTAWLMARLKAHEAGLGRDGVMVWLRKADEEHKAVAEKALPGCKVCWDDSIVLGGARVGNAQVMYDETLDTALEEEKQRFYTTSGLRV